MCQRRLAVKLEMTLKQRQMRNFHFGRRHTFFPHQRISKMETYRMCRLKHRTLRLKTLSILILCPQDFPIVLPLIRKLGSLACTTSKSRSPEHFIDNPTKSTSAMNDLFEINQLENLDLSSEVHVLLGKYIPNTTNRNTQTALNSF